MAFGLLINGLSLLFLDKKNRKLSKWIKSWQDTEHAVYPKLGLLLSNLAIPVNISRISASQSVNEFRENLMLLGTVGLSWCFGHKTTENQIFKAFNHMLKRKYSLDDNILIDKDSTFPEPAKITDMLGKTSHDKKLQREATNLYTTATSLGITAHSALVFVARMFMNTMTKILAK